MELLVLQAATRGLHTRSTFLAAGDGQAIKHTLVYIALVMSIGLGDLQNEMDHAKAHCSCTFLDVA